MTREEKLTRLSVYKEKNYKPGKCAWKYFLNGFLSPFRPIKQKFCPYCCAKVSNEDYYEKFGLFIFGCGKCREKR